VTGLIQAFASSGAHTAELPGLQQVLLDCQYDDGAFSDQYGACGLVDDRDWQGSAYALMALRDYLPQTPEVTAALNKGGQWLASQQDASGAWVYSDTGEHYPEIGGECAAGIAAAWESVGADLVATFDGPDPAMCDVTKTATFNFDRSEGTAGLFGYQVTVEITGPVTVGVWEDLYGMDYFQVLDLGAGVYSVNAALYGSVSGILTDTDLFRVPLTSTGDGAVTLDITDYQMRDPQNEPIYAYIDGDGFTYDCTAPAAVTGITAAPGHNKITVSWTHDGTDVDHYEVFTGLWDDADDAAGSSVYPEYDDDVDNAIPARPADYDDIDADWTGPQDVGLATSWTPTWADESDRGVYYYEVFAVDAAGNVSPAAAANDRATNYWLGDMDADGQVAIIDDINQLGVAFGTADGDGSGNYNANCDVGRTDDGSRLGIPLTDDAVDFEDLMIFAMNFSVVTPSKALPASGPIALAWVELEDGRHALRLLGGDGVQGLRVRAASTAYVSAGDLLSGSYFLKNLGDGLDASLAILGTGHTIRGTGDLMIVEGDIAADDLSITVRGADNAELEFTLDKSGEASTPKVFALLPNTPNPFNPSTKISFRLPEEQQVRLSVYALDGRKVATLLSEPRAAGLHEVTWNGVDDSGRNVSSGTYLCRIEAGPYSRSLKMTLLK